MGCDSANGQSTPIHRLHFHSDLTRARRGLWRYRHQSAVCRQGNVFAEPWYCPGAGKHNWRCVDHLLGIDDRGVTEVRDTGSSCRQPRRRWDHGAARACHVFDSQSPAIDHVIAARGGVRRVIVLWRCYPDARYFGLVRRRGSGGGHVGVPALCRAHCSGLAGLAVYHPETRHENGGQLVRSRMRRLVYRACRERHLGNHPTTGDPQGFGPPSCLAFRNRPRPCVLRRPGFGIARAHGSRGDVRRHGPLRQATHSHRMVRPGGPCAGLELLRPGCAADWPSGSDQQSVLPRISFLGAVSDGRFGHGGHHHRLAGHHLGRVLHDAAGNPAGLSAADECPAHF